MSLFDLGYHLWQCKILPTEEKIFVKRKNVLFIMCDQLRPDYLGCTGHPHIKTPNIDALAARGVNFVNTFCQSPICGPSRASVYTGRYLSSNGSASNWAPLRIGEQNIGHHLNPLGVRTVLTGKTHVIPDVQGMKRLGIDPSGPVGKHHSQAGFEVYERDDGVHPDRMVKPDLAYNEYLKSKGFNKDHNPWHWAANSVDLDNGEIRSGFFNDRVDLPSRVKDEDSETPYMTRRAIEFLESDDGEKPWLLHLSYIKPHWPYVAPQPYNDMYTDEDVIEANRSADEKEKANPLAKLYMERVAGKTFQSEKARRRVLKAYMGLITQIDDQLGILFEFMKNKDLLDDTMIVFTSDHGDYMGDHWMGDKDYFHDASVKVPLIVVDPSHDADSTRGTKDTRLIELVDLLPTFMDFYDGEIPGHVLDGRSLLPLLHGKDIPWRDYAISEYDYSCQTWSPKTNRQPLDCRIYMVANHEWKYIHAPGFPPVLFNLKNDPEELVDLGSDPSYEGQVQAMHNLLGHWALQYRHRETWSEERNIEMIGAEEDLGVLIGYWDEASAEGKDPSILPKRRPADSIST